MQFNSDSNCECECNFNSDPPQWQRGSFDLATWFTRFGEIRFGHRFLSSSQISSASLELLHGIIVVTVAVVAEAGSPSALICIGLPWRSGASLLESRCTITRHSFRFVSLRRRLYQRIGIWIKINSRQELARDPGGSGAQALTRSLARPATPSLSRAKPSHWPARVMEERATL